MSVIAPKLFKNSDSGAPPMDGQAGSLIELLSSCLIIRKAFAAISGGSFLDRTTEARLVGGTAFTMFQTPGTSDEFYMGLCQKFERAKFVFTVPGVGGSYTYQFWNGSAWTTFSPTDGTAGLTASGSLTWVIASLTAWAVTTVNAQAAYWIRILVGSTPSTNPTVDSITLTGWSEAFTGTNLRSYQMGAGAQFYLDVDDAGPGAGTTKEARLHGYEAMTAIATGTQPFPTTTQETNGVNIRKSAATGATTRTWVVACDDRTVYLANIPGDVLSSAQPYTGFGFGDYYDTSPVANPYRCMIVGRISANENSVIGSTTGNYYTQLQRSASSTPASSGRYFPRPYTGIASPGSKVHYATSAMQFFCEVLNSGHYTLGSGVVTYPNEPDGGVYAGQVWLFEGTGMFTSSGNSGAIVRGRMRGFWEWGHLATVVPDMTSFTGVGTLSGRTFILLQPAPNIPGGPAFGALLLETSDTWETN